MEGKTSSSFNFKDKIVIIGTTAMSLHDTKSVPVQEGVYPGVEVHATFLNNIIDGNFIKQTSPFANILIIALVVAVVGLIVMLSESTVFALLSTVLFGIAYLFIIIDNSPQSHYIRYNCQYGHTIRKIVSYIHPSTYHNKQRSNQDNCQNYAHTA